MVNYEILKNIFCVAASRGKEKIIFAQNKHYTPLSDKTLSTKPLTKGGFNQPFYISEMFSFKYKENVEDCYKLLKVKKITPESDEPKEMLNMDNFVGLTARELLFDKQNTKK